MRFGQDAIQFYRVCIAYLFQKLPALRFRNVRNAYPTTLFPKLRPVAEAALDKQLAAESAARRITKPMVDEPAGQGVCF